MLPMTGTAIIIPVPYSSNLLVTKLGAIAGQSFWLVYDILHSNTTAIICGVIAILSGFVGLIAEYIQRKKLQKLSAQSAAKKGLKVGSVLIW